MGRGGQATEDPRVDWICNTAVDALASQNQRESLIASLRKDEEGAINAFLNDASANVLQLSLVPGGIRCSNKPGTVAQCEFQVTMSKLRPGVIQAHDLPRGVAVTSGSNHPLTSLYTQLRSIYGPMLDGTGADQKLKDLMAELQAGLGSALRRGAEGPSGDLAPQEVMDEPNCAALTAILTPSDEFQLWAELAGSAMVQPAVSKRAQQVSAEMEPLRRAFAEFNSLAFEAVMDLIDTLEVTCENLWTLRANEAMEGEAKEVTGWAYGQRRMSHLFDLVSAALNGYLMQSVAGLDLWTSPYAAVEGKLRDGLRLFHRWESMLKELCAQRWASKSQHYWDGAAPDQMSIAFRNRLDEVLKMRDMHEELHKLLSSDEAASLQVDLVFSPFAMLQPLHVSEYTEPTWRAAKAQYEERMMPVETRLSQKLRELFGNVLIPALTAAVSQHGDRSSASMAQPHQVFREFRKYGALLERPVVAKALAAERGQLMTQLNKHLKHLEDDFASISGGKMYGQGAVDSAMHGRNLPTVVDNLAWALQVQEKLRSTIDTFGSLLKAGGEDASSGGAGQGFGMFEMNCKELMRDIDEFKKTQHDEWRSNTNERLDDIKLEKSGKLMDIDVANGHVKLHYNDELVTLLREVRQLTSLGFAVQRDILNEVETARKFYRHGLVLKQVANFYNDIATQMTPCQKPMMLSDAVEFEKVLMNPKDALGNALTWSNPLALEGYVAKLQAVAHRLTDKNRRLRKWHKVLGEKVAGLMALDLVRQKDRWAACIKELREIFTNLEKEGFTRDEQNTWRLHWDHQIYKALEYQYNRGLECLNEALPQMEVKLVFKQKRIQYEPPLEEIRTAHYRAIKSFLSLPITHKGVSVQSEKPGFFRHMVETNHEGVAKVYEKAETLFAHLQEEQKKLTDWVALGTVDLEDFLEDNLDEVSDWEMNFKMLKAASKEAEKLPPEVKVDCYSISLLPIKQAIDEQMKSLQEALVTVLRRKAQSEKDEVEGFINEGKGTLDQQANSIEEIGKARSAAKRLVGSVQKVMQLRRKVEEKNKLLRTVAGSGGGGGGVAAVVDMSALTNEWEDFTTKLQQHESHLDDQKNQLKGQIDKQVVDFRAEVLTFQQKWNDFKPSGAPQGDPQVTLTKMEDMKAMLAEMREKSDKLKGDCEHFSMEAPDLAFLDEVAADVEGTCSSWERFSEFNEEKAKLADADWLSIRNKLYDVDDFLAKWTESVKGTTSKDPVALILLKEINKYRKALPYLKFVRGDGWQDHHWSQLFGMLNFPTRGAEAKTKDNLKLQDFLNAAEKLTEKAEDVKHLHAQAQGEVTLREALHQLEAWGVERRFNLAKHESQTGRKCCLIKEWKDVMTEVGDNQSLVQSLRESPFFGPFKEKTESWENKLATLTECMGALNQVQRKWVYLEPIFGRGALPHEQGRFKKIDTEFRQLMSSIESDPLVTSFAEMPRLRDTLPQMVNQLDICQRALSDFLEEKRSMFPRFYFIGDDDLLEILGQAKNPVVIQSHLKKLFAGIHSVKFSDDKSVITAMRSMDGEEVPLVAPVPVSEAVESWLNDLAKSMKGTLSQMLTKCLSDKSPERFNTFPSQVLCLNESVIFTQMAEQAISQGTLAALHAELSQQLAGYTKVKTEGYHVLQLKIKSLVLDLIHNIDIVDQLMKNQVSSTGDWVWSKQLRYYALKGGQSSVRMAEGDFQYSFEYQGNAPKLVYTPLTDKCYLTLTQGMHLGYGGNPYGPAGTGKTESVKALGQCLGRQVLVFNCDEEFDFKSMGRIFMGLMKVGAWGCFDEFNRLEEDVLSAVSSQIQLIQGALKQRQPQVEFMSKQVNVDFNAGIFVTLNPAGKGYGGRSKLPDNLKALFRSVAMTVPDNELIAEVLLLAEGFTTARDAGRKLVSVFNLSKQLLSPQQHYDWGLRALKTVLGIAGDLLHRSIAEGVVLTPAAEVELIIRSLRVTTNPKLTFDDARRFDDLVRDVFPNVNMSDLADAEIEDAIKEVVKEMGLAHVPLQVEKVLQLHMACTQRIGVIIVGPSGSGKSVLWRILEGAYKRVRNSDRYPFKGAPVVHVMNPKAIPRKQLLGHMDPDTREWFDGVLTAAARQVVKEPTTTHSWIICDGDVDPEWIESLNSVLDDNRLLTLPSGERIQFGPNVNFLFECQDLTFASPATVSRCGMIFLSEENVDVNLVLNGWMATLDESLRPRMDEWVKNYFHRALDWCMARGAAVDTTKMGWVYSAISHLKAATTQRDFCCGLARGLGANLDTEAREEFLQEITRITSEGNLLEIPPVFGQEPVAPATGDNVDLVMTGSVQQNVALLQPWLDNNEPFLLVGPEGSGKSTLLQHLLKRLPSTEVAIVHCSAQTNAQNAVQKLTQICGQPVSTVSGRVLRPKSSEKLILYFKDINLPKPDKYDTIQLIAFLQQLIIYKGFYNEDLEFIQLERIQIVGSMNPATTVGRHPLQQRFTAIVRTAYMTYPTADELSQIYSDMISAKLGPLVAGHPTWGSDATLRKVAATLLDVYDQTKQSFSVDDYRHYLFTPRDLTEWVIGLRRYNLTEIDLMDALVYEGCRIFRDRLVGSDSQMSFDGIIGGVVRSHWRVSPAAGNIFTTWAYTADHKGPGAPELCATGADEFRDVVQRKYIQYERENKELNILLFPEILDRLARFDRVLSTPGGSMLLNGRSGVGRRTGVTLAAYMLRMELVSPNMTRQYGIKEFRADLKGLLQRAGVDNEPVVLFLEDHQLVDTAFLEMVNSLLSGGEIPGLFTNEELEPMLAPIRDAMQTEGFEHKTLFSYFTSRVARNLHVVISMDPTNPDYTIRCESNPALYTRCSLQWLESWSDEGMTAVPNMLLEEVFNASDEDYDEQIVEQMGYVHGTCTHLGATPRQFVWFVQMYEKIFSAKRTEQLEQRSFLQSGLNKLQEAATAVDGLSREASSQRVLLEEKQAQAEQALSQITAAMAQAGTSKTEVEALQIKLSEEEGVLTQRKTGIEDELREVEPMLEAARKAVGQIKSDNINEIRSLKMPPDAIRDVLEGVLKLMGQSDTSWSNMRAFLGKRSVKEEVINFDARKVHPSHRSDVMKLLQQKANSFEHAVIFRVSVAAAPLAAWVKANVKYSMILERIAPMEQELHALEDSLSVSRDRLAQCEEELSTLDTRVSALKSDFARRTGEAEALKLSLQKAVDQLEAAESLLGKLGGEKGRWEEQVQRLSYELKALPLNSLMSAAFITYLPDASEDLRAQMVGTWMAYTKHDSFNFRLFMSSESEMLVWKSEGLPSDDLSMENAIVILHGLQAPLIIDPSTQASAWLEAHIKKEKQAGVEVATLHDERFTTTLELAVRFGKTLIVKEVDRIEPMLYPLLRRDLQRQGPRWTVQIGDKAIDYNESFKLYLVTRNPYPDVPPDADSLIAKTNFTVTRSGLEGQLLGLTIQQEQPELEQQKSTLLAKEEDLKVQLAALEKQLLETLAKAEGNILENKTLIESLNETKVKSNTIAEALEESHTLQVSLNEKRDVYRPIAKKGSVMFFLLRDLRAINHMYQFSLSTFIRLFKHALSRGEASANVESRIAMLSHTLLKLVFDYACQSLFNADRLTFGMHMARHISPELFGKEEWDFFLGLALQVSLGGGSRPTWVREEAGAAYLSLTTTFPALASSCRLDDGSVWGQWAMSAEPEKSMPAGGINAFQQLLLVKAFRPDRLESAMSSIITSTLQINSVSPPPFSMQRVYDASEPREPTLFLVSPGSDPSQELEEFADKLIGRGRYHQVAMGQGQSEIALALLRQCAKSGDWLVLKNLHLVVGWLPTLEKEIYSLNAHPEFRLWLTTEPHDKFPPSLLEGCRKITFEAPPGIKKNIQRTYEGWGPEFIASGTPLRAQLLFVLAWFHAIVQERRKYIPQGWSKFYEFSFADLRSGADIISIGTKDGRVPQWSFIHGLLENAIYGGRVDNAFDVAVLRTYLESFFSPDVVSHGGQRTRPLPGTRNTIVPTNNNHADFITLINSLPEVDLPSLFTLPANIDRTAQQANSEAVIASLRHMAQSNVATKRFDRELWSQRLAPLFKLWETLIGQKPQYRDPFKPDPRPAPPVTTFVGMERSHGRRICGLVDRTLSHIQKVIRGIEMLSPATMKQGSSLLAGEIPAEWDSLWEGPEDPLKYMQAVVRKMQAVEGWYALCSKDALLTSPLDLSHLYHPITFLNALRQQTARQVKTSMDNLMLVTSWDPARLSHAGLPISVNGLLVQGAMFNGKQLSDVAPEASTSNLVPQVVIAWIKKDEPMPYPSFVGVPLYLTNDRSKLLSEVQLPLAEGKTQRVLNGTALFLNEG